MAASKGAVAVEAASKGAAAGLAASRQVVAGLAGSIRHFMAVHTHLILVMLRTFTALLRMLCALATYPAMR